MTVKQIADSLNVSKSTVNRTATALNLTAVKVSNRLEYSAEDYEAIKSHITHQTHQTSQNNALNAPEMNKMHLMHQTQQASQTVDIMLLAFQEQLSVKDQQIEALQKALIATQESLQQTLQLLNTSASESEPEPKQEQPQQPEQPSRNIFTRLFGKK